MTRTRGRWSSRLARLSLSVSVTDRIVIIIVSRPSISMNGVECVFYTSRRKYDSLWEKIRATWREKNIFNRSTIHTHHSHGNDNTNTLHTVHRLGSLATKIRVISMNLWTSTRVLITSPFVTLSLLFSHVIFHSCFSQVTSFTCEMYFLFLLSQ